MTIHETVAALDAGPIAAQEAFPIGPRRRRRRRLRARRRARRRAPRARCCPRRASRRSPSEGVTYAEKIGAADRELDLADPLDAWRRVRALSPHIGARATLDGRRGHRLARPTRATGAFVPDEVQPEGRRRMSYDEFLRGLRP